MPSGFFGPPLCDRFHEVASRGRFSHSRGPAGRSAGDRRGRPPTASETTMDAILPVLLFVAIAAAVSVGLVVFAQLVGPRRSGAVKEMPYESGMDPIHDTRRRFDVRFHLVAITFLVFDVELLFLYPWAVASRSRAGIDAAVADGLVSSRGLVFAGAMLFVALVIVGFAYDWRKGVFRWR
jgi:NADH-quinone oxidoreductase subunit A